MKKPKGGPKPVKPPPRTLAINPTPKGELKRIGGSMADDWNLRLLNSVGGSLPDKGSNDAVLAVCHAMVDMAPADPVEGMLIAQLVAANEASLAMYRKGWSQPPEYFQAEQNTFSLPTRRHGRS